MKEPGRGELRWTPNNQAMVEALKRQYPQVKTGKLAVREIFTAFPEVNDVEFNCVPDGIVIDAEDRRIDLFEIEVTHAIPRSTIRKICDLFVACDFAGITLDLYVMNRYGHINQMDLGHLSLALFHDWPTTGESFVLRS